MPFPGSAPGRPPPPSTSCSATASGRWRGHPATINPALHGTDRLAIVKDWPPRAGITGAGGAPLIAAQHLVDVGLVGSRIKNAQEVGADLIGAGATAAEVKAALAQAKAHPHVLRARLSDLTDAL